jgi:O-antigen/teichoic acid export membrane protein
MAAPVSRVGWRLRIEEAKHFLGKTVKPLGTEKAIYALFGGTMLAQVIPILVAPILAHLYTPYDFGIVTIFSSLLNFLLIVATFRFEYAAQLVPTDHEARGIVAVCITASILMSVVALIVAVTFPTAGIKDTWIAGFWPYRWFLPLGIFAGGFFQAVAQLALRLKNYSLLTRGRINQGISSALGSVALGLFTAGPFGLLCGSVLSNSAGGISLAKGCVKGVSRRDIIRQAARYSRFALSTSTAALLNACGLLLPALLLTKVYDENVSGSFGLASRIVSLPMLLLGAAAGQIFLAEASSALRTAPEKVPMVFHKSVRMLSIAACLLALSSFALPSLFRMIFGLKWDEAGHFASMLIYVAAGQLIVSPVSNISVLLEKQKIQMFLDGLRAFLVVAVFWIAQKTALPAKTTIALYVAAMLLFYGINYLAYAWILRVRFRLVKKAA